MYDYTDIKEIIGKTVLKIVEGNYSGENALYFYFTDDTVYVMYHNQDCCENVYIEDIDGDLTRLFGQEIGDAYESSNSEDDPPENDNYESYTWTFYTIRTNKDSVTIRWFGSSNGYYSESVGFYRIK